MWSPGHVPALLVLGEDGIGRDFDDGLQQGPMTLQILLELPLCGPSPNSRVTKGHLESQATLTIEIASLFESPDVLEAGFQ
jgi:hypothetical protein